MTQIIILFIGSALKFLFGTMSENDSKEIQKLIDANNNKSLSLSELLAKQTEIVMQEFKTMSNDIKKLKKFNDVLTDTIKDLYRDTEMKHMIDTTTVIIRKYSIQVSLLTNAILFASKGVILPRFVTAKTLGDAEKFATNTRPNLAYPSKLRNSTALEVIAISDLTIFLYNNQLVYLILIPLLNKQTFELYKSSPLPVKQ